MARSNVRQRTKGLTRRGSRECLDQTPADNAVASSWEITSDDEDTTLHLEQTKLHPLHQEPEAFSHRVLPPAPGSLPTSWRKYASSDNSKTLRVPLGPSSLSGLRTYPVIRTPLMVPDSSYQAYLLGESTKRKKPILDTICCAKFCAVFSWIAVAFLVLVGILLDTQPLYIRGTLPQHIQYTTGRRPRIFYSTALSERLPAASHAYQAAFVYLLTGLFSLGYAYNLGWWIKTRWRRYQDIPDDADDADSYADSTIPTFHTPGDDTSSMPTRAYQHNIRISNKIWNFITSAVAVGRGMLLDTMRQNQQKPRRRATGTKDV
jgi:hypothetical protein